MKIILCILGSHKWETLHAPGIATWTQCEDCHKQLDGYKCRCIKCKNSKLRGWLAER